MAEAPRGTQNRLTSSRATGADGADARIDRGLTHWPPLAATREKERQSSSTQDGQQPPQSGLIPTPIAEAETMSPPGFLRSRLASIQGLKMESLLEVLETLPRWALLDEETARVVGGPRLVLAMRAVRARREHDIVGFVGPNSQALRTSIPPDQFTAIFVFLSKPSERDAENVNYDARVRILEVKAHGLLLRGQENGENRSLEPDQKEQISEFEARILRDRSLISSAILDPDSGEIIGYRVPVGDGLRRIVDRNGGIVFQSEIGLEPPALDPIDFADPTLLKAVGKAAISVGSKVIAKAAAKLAVTQGAKEAATLPFLSIVRLRRVSRTLRKFGKKTIFGAGRTLKRPKNAIPLRAKGPIHEQLLEWAVDARRNLIAKGVDWGESNIACARVLVDGKMVKIVVDNPELAVHAENQLIKEVEKIAEKKSVQVLQIFSERIPCGVDFAGCKKALLAKFPAADIFYGVSGETLESNVYALQRIYGLRP